MQRKTARNSFDNVSGLLDATNIAILKVLLDDPRIAMSSLARHVGMSAPAVTERVQLGVRLATARQLIALDGGKAHLVV